MSDSRRVGRPPVARPTAALMATLDAARGLALRGVRHWWLRNLLLAMLIAFAVTSYLATSLLGGEALGAIVPEARLGLEDLFVARLSGWGYRQLRFLQSPDYVEVPDTEVRFRPLVTPEPGSELAMLRADPRVERAWVARWTTVHLPWGTVDMFSAPTEFGPSIGGQLLCGDWPAQPDQVAVPAEVAARMGLSPGDQVPFRAVDPEYGSVTEGFLRVSGVFDLDHPLFTGPLGWCPPDMPTSWATDMSAHAPPRALVNFPPNSYLIWLRPGTNRVHFALWLVEDYFVDDDGCYHFHARYPVRQVWNDEILGQVLAEGVAGGAMGLSGIMMLSLGFVGVGALTMFLLSFLDRRREIAVLKTLGYAGGDLAAVFGMEVAYVGLAGLVLGLVAGYGAIGAWLGRALPVVMVLRAAVITLVVLAASALLPIAMAVSATVTELLLGRRVIAIFRQRVGYSSGPGRGTTGSRSARLGLRGRG